MRNSNTSFFYLSKIVCADISSHNEDIYIVCIYRYHIYHAYTYILMVKTRERFGRVESAGGSSSGQWNKRDYTREKIYYVRGALPKYGRRKELAEGDRRRIILCVWPVSICERFSACIYIYILCLTIATGHYLKFRQFTKVTSSLIYNTM